MTRTRKILYTLTGLAVGSVLTLGASCDTGSGNLDPAPSPGSAVPAEEPPVTKEDGYGFGY